MKMMSVKRLLLMAVLHFAAMYILMYSMVNTLDNIFPNLNQFYMAGIMTAPMLVFEALLMGSMYQNKKALMVITASSIAVFVFFFLFIRQQIAIADNEFIRSMIPHHSGAILMCERSELQDEELKELCQEIIAAQQSEIDQMKQIMNRLNNQ